MSWFLEVRGGRHKAGGHRRNGELVVCGGTGLGSGVFDGNEARVSKAAPRSRRRRRRLRRSLGSLGGAVGMGGQTGTFLVTGWSDSVA